ncbi:cob(I)yrinic acid a,c-diamide adenosyltransferase [Candidatus Marsarchaeota archaeon]|nr:cob(I)yrinic acid a,c-diamide adenosyltransferase [Candidatus Marsarchaeota archaeon]MCL5404693.1 cob(I)yrinic acid a,c-diamide adenosyltransferase [Candidatus Marsarchaeota archaeon]
MNRYYSGTGDKKETGIGSVRLKKGAPIFEAIGDVDELNAKVSHLLAAIRQDPAKYGLGSAPQLEDMLLEVENRLFSVGAELASISSQNFKPKASISAEDVKYLENATERLSKEFPELRSFVLPGGCIESAIAEEARTLARRAERSIVRLSETMNVGNDSLFPYMNRLSSFFFVASRFINKRNGVEELSPRY